MACALPAPTTPPTPVRAGQAVSIAADVLTRPRRTTPSGRCRRRVELASGGEYQLQHVDWQLAARGTNQRLLIVGKATGPMDTVRWTPTDRARLPVR